MNPIAVSKTALKFVPRTAETDGADPHDTTRGTPFHPGVPHMQRHSLAALLALASKLQR